MLGAGTRWIKAGRAYQRTTELTFLAPVLWNLHDDDSSPKEPPITVIVQLCAGFVSWVVAMFIFPVIFFRLVGTRYLLVVLVVALISIIYCDILCKRSEKNRKKRVVDEEYGFLASRERIIF